MKALAIKQPWAQLVAAGTVQYLIRNSKTNYRGQVEIYASKSRVNQGLKWNGANIMLKQLSYGAIIASAELTDCLHIDDHYWYELQNVKKYEEPYYVRGQRLLGMKIDIF
jgi:hypothetical protein